jgi:hypothetical protein
VLLVAAMTLKQFLIVLFVALAGGIMLPLSHGVRMALFLALTSLTALTVLGGGMQYMLRVFH